MVVATGILTLVCFLLLAVKYPLRKLGMNKANALMMKLHEAASGSMFILSIVHMIMAVRKKKNPLLIISGAVVFAICFVIVAACHMTKDVKVKMKWHRLLTLAAVIAIIGHMLIFFI